MIGRKLVVIWTVTKRKIMHQTNKWPMQIIHKTSSMKPMNRVDVLEALNSQTTGAKPTNSKLDNATIEQSMPATELNLASRPPMHVKM